MEALIQQPVQKPVKGGAERQKAYRQSRTFAGQDQLGERRLNTWAGTSAALALARLARHHQITQRAMLEQLIQAEDQKVIDALDPDQPEWLAYLGK